MASPDSLKSRAPSSSKLPHLAFGIGGFGVSVIYSTMGVLLLYFYTHVYGLTPAQAGTILFIAALFDAAMDPFIGWIASRTRTRFGRYRPFLLFGAVPLSIGFIVLFMAPSSPTLNIFAYALVTYTVFRALFQLIYMPYTSLIAQLTDDADERSDIEGWRAWFVAAATLFISFYGLKTVEILGAGDDRAGFLRMAVVVGAISAVAFLITVAFTRERLQSNDVAPDVTSPVEVARALAANKPFWIVSFATVLAQTAHSSILNATVNFFAYQMGDRDLSRYPLAALTMAGLVASFVWPSVSRRYGKRLTWVAGALLAAASMMTTYFFMPQTATGMILPFLIAGFGYQGVLIIQFAAAADTIDYGEWKTGKRAEAISFAIMTSAMKFSLAVGAGLVGWLYALAGLVPGHTQSADTLSGMRMIQFIVPGVGFALSALVASRYTISSAQHRQIINDLGSRRT